MSSSSSSFPLFLRNIEKSDFVLEVEELILEAADFLWLLGGGLKKVSGVEERLDGGDDKPGSTARDDRGVRNRTVFTNVF